MAASSFLYICPVLETVLFWVGYCFFYSVGAQERWVVQAISILPEHIVLN